MPENAEHHNDDAANENAAPEEETAKKKIKVEKPDQPEKDDADILSEEREGFSDPLEFLSAELDRVEAEKAELQERALRIAADMENLRRRTQKDVADARAFSISSFAREMLAVSDNLQRALQAIPQEAREGGDEGFKALIEGVELTERSMMQALEKNGVKRISPLNERFDPNFHQAMFEIPNDKGPNNTVLQVVQDGFVIGERCLRP
ncbi:MAG: nucleotide exchange factor GrpE, partial [Pseudomonadota bacterium]